ncbi:MAG: ABC transporter permease subunit [Candidatus Rokubacteria bacterium]|nr:ABC transporter permease subunit [Candidatus Rokubacteria bacterium]
MRISPWLPSRCCPRNKEYRSSSSERRRILWDTLVKLPPRPPICRECALWDLRTWPETVIMRLTDILMAFPYILLAIAIVAGLGPGLRNAMIATAIVGFPIYTRLVRGIVLSVRGREFVEAARALGSPDRLILVRHIVPQLISPVVVAFSLDVGAKILAAAGLSFLGLGAEARRLGTAVGRVYRDGKTLTPDQGGAAKTREMTQAVLAAYQNPPPLERRVSRTGVSTFPA